MAEYDRYINLPGFDNVNRALTFLNVPKDIVGNLGDASVDAIVNPDDLPMRERIGRGIEAGIGTLAYGAGPLIAKLMGQKAAQAIPETLMGFSGPQAAEEVVKDVVQDPGRRKFIGGVAAALPVAALAPDLITDVATQVAKRGPRGPVTSIFTSSAANIRELKRQIQDLQELKDDIDFRDNPNETPALTKELEDQYVQVGRDQGGIEKELRDEYSEVFEMLNDDPVLIKNAPDDDLEFVLENVYEDDVDLYDVVTGLNLENDMSEVIAAEIKKRKLHLQKDKNGVDKYPYAKIFIEDYTEVNLGPISMPLPNVPLKMVDDGEGFKSFETKMPLSEKLVRGLTGEPLSYEDYIKKVHNVEPVDYVDTPQEAIFDAEYEGYLRSISGNADPNAIGIVERFDNRKRVGLESYGQEDQDFRVRKMMSDELKEELERGREKKLSSEEIDTNVAYLRGQLEKKYGIPFSKAMGGPVEGIASLSDTARDMYRGPRGIGSYQQFMSG